MSSRQCAFGGTRAEAGTDPTLERTRVQILKTATADEVYYQILKSEARYYHAACRRALQKLLSKPDFNDVRDNSLRREFLFGRREPLLARLPDSTEWHFGSLDEQELEGLYVIRNDDWGEICPGYQLGKVCYPEGCSEKTRKKIKDILATVARPEFDRTIILIGTNARGPFTILDGNHRAVAMVLAVKNGGLSGIRIPAFLGLSPMMGSCVWYACPQSIKQEHAG